MTAQAAAQAATVASNGSVLDEERFGLLAEAAPVQEEQVAEEPVHHERERRDEPPRVVGGQRVAGVRRNRRRRDDREQLVDERRRVARERGPRLHPLEAQLRPTLAESDEEREQEGAEQQPLRDPDVDGDRAGRRPEHEQPRDRDHVDELERLQAERVRGLEDRERDHARERRGAERRTEGQRERAEGRCERKRRPGRELAARDRTAALDRVQAVGGNVAHVVDEVGGARRRAVRDERGDRRHPPARVAELRGEHDPREQEEVLRPLSRPERSERRDDGRSPARELDDRRVGASVTGRL